MRSVSPQSLRHEYELYFDREVESYKNSVSRAHLCAIADAAQVSLDAAPQLGLHDLLLAAEVNRHIARRLSIPDFGNWSRRRLRHANEPTRAECWGLRADTPLSLAIHAVPLDAHVLVNGARVESSALYLAANGCRVTAVEPEADVVERVLVAASAAGLRARVRGLATELCDFRPDGRLTAVVFTPAALASYSECDREEVIDRLQNATEGGGVHVVETIVAGQEAIDEDELRACYAAWHVSFVPEPGAARTFVARKPPSLNAQRAWRRNESHNPHR